MEWIVTTGRTVDEAKEAALDQLGVAEEDVEYEVEQQAQTGLFGRLRSEARVRARVRPMQPRPKIDRRPERRRGKGKEGGGRSGGQRGKGRSEPDSKGSRSGSPPSSSGTRKSGGAPEKAKSTESTDDDAHKTPRPEKNAASTATKGGPVEGTTIPLDGHAELMRVWVEGLVEAFDLDDAEVGIRVDDDEHAEVVVDGSDIGLLIGNKGATLQAVQTLARSVAQRQADGSLEGRVGVDIGGYRQRRREALERFAREVASTVVEAGESQRLEPMGSADRKVVHDALTDTEGVQTRSVGEEPNRCVVIEPADG